MAEVKDDYLEQLKVEADWAGTYLSGDGTERTIQDVLRLHVNSSQSMWETFCRVGTPEEQEYQRGVTAGLRRAIEVADVRAARSAIDRH